jgi:glycosyltransferase involved in cell wall biosynthesis
MSLNIAIIENHIISANTVRQKLIHTLMEKGHQVTILSTGSVAEMNLARSKGFNLIDVGTSNTKPHEVLLYMKKLKSALKRTKADVCLTFTMRPAIWGNIITRRLNIPTITNITGIGPLAESNSVVYKVARMMYKFVLQKTTKVFFQNKDDMNVFLSKKFIQASQAEIIPGSGVDTEWFKPQQKKHRNDDKFVFLFISRLIRDKGIIEYVDAAKIMRTINEDLLFEVLGPYYSQNLKENIITEKQIVQWVEHGTVVYLGAADDVRPFIAEADCVVLPSYREGMSNVLLEAASMQKPCITTNVTGCKDIVVDGVTGFLCNARDTDSLVKMMNKMQQLSPEERDKMGITARELVKEKFAKRFVISAYEKAIAAATSKNVEMDTP